MLKPTLILLAIAATLPIASVQAATRSDKAVAPSSSSSFSASLSPAQRGAAISQFVHKWGSYVEGVYGLDAGTWSGRLVSQFSRGDATNIQRAMSRTTFEGAMAELSGSGHKLSDDRVITTLATSSASNPTPNLLGSFSNDLVYTPLTPCRIVDTRNTAAGAIASNAERGFYVWNSLLDYTTQGGASTKCGLTGESPEAVVVNITVVTPVAGGYATAYPDNATKPLAATMTYAAGDVISNTAVLKIGSLGVNDFRIYTLSQAQYVVDIVGYYDAPHATAVDCVTVVGTGVTIPDSGAAATSLGGTCAANYASVGAECRTSSSNGIVNQTTRTSCDFTDRKPGDTFDGGTGTAYSICCRIPGR